MRIWLKPDVMAEYHLVPTDVTQALAEQNIEAAPGSFGEQGNQTFEYTIRYKGRLQKPAEFDNIVIKAKSDGQVLHLKDIATIELGRLTYSFVNKVDGHNAVMCVVNQMPGTNATAMPYVSIMSGARLGKRNRIFQGAVIAAEPQDFAYKGEDTLAVIGDDNIIRKNVVINRASFASNQTVIGNGNFLHEGVHISHGL